MVNEMPKQTYNLLEAMCSNELNMLTRICHSEYHSKHISPKIMKANEKLSEALVEFHDAVYGPHANT